MAAFLAVRRLRSPGGEPLDFGLAAGEALAIMGPSGAGKTRLLRAIADLDPNDIDVSLEGVDRSGFPGPEWRKRVTYVAATPGWWASTVGEHFRPEHRTAANAMLAALLLPREALAWPIDRLSTGEAQRLSLIRASVQDSKVLLLDEPTAPLDDQSTASVETLLHERMANGTALVLVSHDSAQVRRLAKHCLRMDQTGRVSVEKP